VLKFYINFINKNTEIIDPKSNKFVIENRKETHYDYLVMTTSYKLNKMLKS